MDSVLRPRDIQARIRSGESPETVAAAAQTTVEKVMRYATPVLAERAYVAQQAQKASVRRRAGNGPVGHLGAAVAEQLAADDLDPESVEWDSWRREDGRWTLVADYAATDGARRACFVYDVAGRYVVADDDESRRLVGERASTPVTLPLAEEGVDHPQTALGDDAIELVTGRRPEELLAPTATLPEGTADLAGEATVDLSEAARIARSASPPVPAPEEWILTQASDRPAGLGRAASPGRQAASPAQHADEALFDASEAAAPGQSGSPVPEQTAEPAPVERPDANQPAAVEQPDAGQPVADERPDTIQPAAGDEAATGADEAAAGRPRKPRKTARSKGRASVPSWDEIMFGSGRGDGATERR